ncbi:hypothetical protein F4859DRAFT_511059 [Xylaria cf. heliscus]|nr:hypothetical protein F4859DRAFT_511059 [Xylaria cf. heliscus]
MLSSILLLVPAFGLVAQAESYWPKRPGMTCESTYGNGSMPCGGPESTGCYNPGLGQICCQDNGFCDSGSYCAPAGGYCCSEDEDLAVCARNNGFDRPSSAIEYITMATPAGAIRTFTVTPFLAGNPGPTPVNTPVSNVEGTLKPSVKPSTEVTTKSSTACHKLPAISTPMVIQISNMSASSPIQLPTSVLPVVQVSVAAERGALVGYIATLAAASVIVLL